MILVTLGLLLVFFLLSYSRDDIPLTPAPEGALYAAFTDGISIVRILLTSSAMENPGTAEKSQ
jgi:hypothetical protein